MHTQTYRKAWMWLLTLLALGFALGVGAAQWRVGRTATVGSVALMPMLSGDRAAAIQPPAMQIKPDQLELRLAFFGDVFWGRYIHDWSSQHPLQQAYPFSKFDDFGKFTGEYWIGNLECPVTQIETTSAQQEARLKFNCLPDYLPEAARWFDAFSLANNHTDDWNEYDGFTVTKTYLDQHGLRYFGHYANKPEEICKVLAIPAQHSGFTYRLPVALCGYHGVFRQITEAEIAVMADYAPYMPVIAMPHAGAEYVTDPGRIKVATYRRMIDHGAAMVIGGHPHAVQSTELYQGRLIVYSQGNFLFDQQRGILRTTHLGIRARLQISDPAYIAAAIQLPESCFNSATLCPAIAANLPTPQYHITYEPFYTANPERLPRLAYPHEVDYIKRVSGIEETLSQLQP